jgi:hypothetical protein
VSEVVIAVGIRRYIKAIPAQLIFYKTVVISKFCFQGLCIGVPVKNDKIDIGVYTGVAGSIIFGKDF